VLVPTDDIRPVATSTPRPPGTFAFAGVGRPAVEVAAYLQTVEGQVGAWVINTTLTVYPVFAGAGALGLLDSELCAPPVYTMPTFRSLDHGCDRAVSDPASTVLYSALGDAVYYGNTEILQCTPHLLESCGVAVVCVEPYRISVYGLEDGTVTSRANWTYVGTYGDEWWGTNCDGSWVVYGTLDGVLTEYPGGAVLGASDAVGMTLTNSRSSVMNGTCVGGVCSVSVLTGTSVASLAEKFTVVVPVYSLRGARMAFVADFAENPSPTFNLDTGAAVVLFVAVGGEVHRLYVGSVTVWNPPYAAVVDTLLVYGQFIALSGNGTTRLHDAGSMVLSSTTALDLCEGGTVSVPATVYEIGGSSTYAAQYTGRAELLVGLTYNSSSRRVELVWSDGTWTEGIQQCADLSGQATVRYLHALYGTTWCSAVESDASPYLFGSSDACQMGENGACAEIDLPAFDGPTMWTGSSFCRVGTPWENKVCAGVHRTLSSNQPIAVLLMYTGTRMRATPDCSTYSESKYLSIPPRTRATPVYGGVRMPVTPSPVARPTSLPTVVQPVAGHAMATRCLASEHVTVPATATTDAVCRPKVWACPEGEYRNASSNDVGATGPQCLPCPDGTTTCATCDSYHTATACTSEPYTCPTGQYLGAGVGHPSKLCRPCTVCLYELRACTATNNSVCTFGTGLTDTPCPPRTYRNDAVAGPRGICTPCSECWLTRVACTRVHDSVCSSFSRDAFYFEVAMTMQAMALGGVAWWRLKGHP
jgi:hypothetical protein